MKPLSVLLVLLLLLSAGVAAAGSLPAGTTPEDLLQRLAAPKSPEPVPASPAASLLEGAVDPARYRVDAGDWFRVQALGRTTFALTAQVNAEGWLDLGEYGTVRVARLTLDEARQRIRTRFATILRGTEVEVHLLQPRRFKVFVLGEVEKPGAYPATAATRASEAIALAGGLRDSASVRAIRIHRADESEPLPVDLIPFRFAGDVSGNPFLLDGDRIVVPKRTRTFEVSGEVEHPGRWDLPPGETLEHVLQWVGVKPGADLSRAVIARFRGDGPGDRFDTLSVVLERVLSREDPVPLADGDRVYIRRLPRYHEAYAVRVEGEVRYPGEYPIRQGEDRLRDVVERAGGLLPGALETRVALIRPVFPDSTFRDALRTMNPGFPITPSESARLRLEISPDVDRMTVDLRRGENPLLVDGDRVVVPRSPGFVRVTGQVMSPGLYPFRENWNYKDYLSLAGGTTKLADRGHTRLLRGRQGTSADAARAERIEAGDILFVPEKKPRTTWQTAKDLFTIAAQAATVIIVVDQVIRK